MNSGSFFKVDLNSKDFSVYYYMRIVNSESSSLDNDDRYPFYLKLTKSFIGFYVHISDDKPISQVLFHLPTGNQYGESRPSDILVDIFNETIPKSVQERVEDNPSYRIGYTNTYPVLNDSIWKYKRNIFLDFLFDFTHSEVFENWYGIEKLKYFIYNNYFINSIWSKCEFIFSRNEYIHYSSRNLNDRKYNYVFSSRLRKAEQAWLNILLNEESKKFNFSNGWFKNVEDEIEDFLFCKKPGFDRSRWHIQFMDSLKGEKEKKFELGKIISERNDIYSFYIKRYEFFKPYKLLLHNLVLRDTLRDFVAILLLMTFGLSIISLFFFFDTAVYWIFLLACFGFLTAVLLPLSYVLIDFVIDICKSFGYKPKKMYPFVDNVKISTPRMTIFILAGWLTLYPFSIELWELNSKLPSRSLHYILLSIVPMLIVFFTISYEIDTIEPFRKIRKTGQRLIIVFLLGFSFSVMFGLLIQHLSCFYMFDKKAFFKHDVYGIKVRNDIQNIYNMPVRLFELEKKISSTESNEIAFDSIDMFQYEFAFLDEYNDYNDKLLNELKRINSGSMATRKKNISILIKEKIQELERDCYNNIKSTVQNYLNAIPDSQHHYMSKLKNIGCRCFCIPENALVKFFDCFYNWVFRSVYAGGQSL